jgi:NhaA family Na+:H+ antiporter
MTSTNASDRRVRRIAPLRDFLHTEAAGGLMLVAVIALIWANSPWRDTTTMYRRFRCRRDLRSTHIRHWVNDALMAVFFLIVGLRDRASSTTAPATAPHGDVAGDAALGGMVVPAGIYLAIAGGTALAGPSRWPSTSHWRSV